MAVSTWATKSIGRVCSICKSKPATVQSVLTDPLIVSVHTFTCPGCYSTNASASAALIRQSPRLVLTECAA